MSALFSLLLMGQKVGVDGKQSRVIFTDKYWVQSPQEASNNIAEMWMFYLHRAVSMWVLIFRFSCI